MKKNRFGILALSSAFGLTTAAVAAGCGTIYEDWVEPLFDPSTAIWNDGGADGADGSNPDCTGDPSPTNVTDACGVFAQADAPAGGNGTQAMPFTTLAAAITEAQSTGKRVYACTSAPFNEAVTISAGIEVYGGLDCTKGWAWSQSARAQLDGPANGAMDAVTLTITAGASSAKVEGFAITSANLGGMTNGASSIGVAVDNVAATLEACDVTAGDAAAGSDGTTSSTPVVPGATAPMPVHGQEDACINPLSLVGGAPGATMCGTVDTSGGSGGKGGITATMSGNGQSGTNGANPVAMPKAGMDGLGGMGQTDPAGNCQIGDPGAPGVNGAAGPGGSALGDMLTLAGIVNSDQTDGQPGTPGQGGGGGGGAMSGMFCLGAVDGNGASGGGGGAGGCGGLGGGGGKAGGSSIAIVSLGTSLALTSVTLTVGTGGSGGSGSLGQGGGAYGNGANGGAAAPLNGSNSGCSGGNGGKGGGGGPGGGGRGGHAIGIAYATAPATMPMIQKFTAGMAGSGGTPGATGNAGAMGAAGQCWDFTTQAACE